MLRLSTYNQSFKKVEAKNTAVVSDTSEIISIWQKAPVLFSMDQLLPLQYPPFLFSMLRVTQLL